MKIKYRREEQEREAKKKEKEEKEEKRPVSLPAMAAVLLIRGYQIFISPFLGARCRFYPSCSQYALAVFSEWGFMKGAWLTLKRLLKCGPWHEGGYDPPPGKNFKKIQNRPGR